MILFPYREDLFQTTNIHSIWYVVGRNACLKLEPHLKVMVMAMVMVMVMMVCLVKYNTLIIGHKSDKRNLSSLKQRNSQPSSLRVSKRTKPKPANIYSVDKQPQQLQKQLNNKNKKQK